MTQPVEQFCSRGSLNVTVVVWFHRYATHLLKKQWQPCIRVILMTLNNNSQLHFRYLDSMFALDPELGEIVSAMSFEGLSQDFSVAKWASEDKIDSRQYP
ncbi:hypothetical protein O9929_03300 [Vibrio lentus]|nr:hypothetical protein [Vibrio lentus]